MDVVTHLPKTKHGFDALFVIVDYVTKMMVLRPTYSMAIAVDTARLFVDAVVRAHGLSRVTVSDRDTRFTSHFWSEVQGNGYDPGHVFGFSPPNRWSDGESQPVY